MLELASLLKKFLNYGPVKLSRTGSWTYIAALGLLHLGYFYFPFQIFPAKVIFESEQIFSFREIVTIQQKN